ncbi:MAG: sialate O-acetylesterase [Chlorobi bacterium]|nr:sialate O-acetylesterase [Chlorobiota bacterium]
MKKLLVLSIILSIHVCIAFADIRLPELFSNNMILQREMQVPVWGWADPGEKITVELGGHFAETVTGTDGKWKLLLGPLDAGGPFRLKITGKNTIIISNVLVGEVWVCSGQSNMAMEVQNCLNAKQEISSASYPQIRYFQVKRTKAIKPLDDVSPVENESGLNKWEVCDPTTVEHFTGAGYFFVRDLYKKLNVPIGIISASWGGTTAEAWTPYDTLENDPELKIILKNWPDYNNDEEWLKEEYEKYLKNVEKARKEGKTRPLYFNQPSVLYNGIIAPVVPYGIRGVAWYQGESNCYRAYQYRKLFPAMIEQWRKKWGQGNFPFLFVQLANYYFEPQNFPELREAQSMALSLANTAMVVTIDIGDSSNIHPKNKQEVGRRLSLAARKLAYGEDLIYSGPHFKSMQIMDGKCRLSFCHIGDGLMAKGFIPLKGFIIAGTDKNFVTAQARIENNQVVVWSKVVPHPVAVRYAWANHPGNCNLYNKSGELANLPASPFRTDDWPGITINRK